MKKKRMFFSRSCTNDFERQILMKMKFTLILLLVGITNLMAVESYSQSTRLNIELGNTSVEKVLENIENQSEFRFVYNRDAIDLERKVKMNTKNASIEKVLDDLFEETNVKYQLIDRTVVLTTVTSAVKSVQPQQKSISGKVTDENGEPLPGVTVHVKGTTNGTVTNFDGEYSIVGVDAETVLQFSFVGMKSQEVVVGSQNNIDIVLATDAIGIEEVVAIGYGVQRKEDLTSSVASISSEEFNKGAIKSVGQLIQGKTAGLSIVNPSGDPNGGLEMQIRGVLSLSGSTTPLVVIDGIPATNSNMAFSMLAPEDVESVDVLKDGSAAAIYGTRGNNGVILITTKKGQKGKLAININSFVSVEQIKNRMEVLSKDQYLDLIDEVGERLSISRSDVDMGYETNWLDEIQSDAVNQSHYISVQGGGENSSVIASANYKTHEGIMLNTGRNSLKTRLYYTQSAFDNKVQFEAGVINQSSYLKKFDTGAFRQAILRNPTDRITDDNGDYLEYPGLWAYINPIAMLKERTDDEKQTATILNGKITIEPLKNLKLSAFGVLDKFTSMSGYASTRKHPDSTIESNQIRASRSSYLRTNKNLELIGSYKLYVDDHAFSLMGGYSYFMTENESFSASNNHFPTDAFGYNNLGLGQGLLEKLAGMSSSKGDSKLIAFFSRVNYSFMDKYLLSASIRREGSTKFGANNKWGNFPAISAGWKISNEPFFNVSFIDNLKLRAGYGVTGSEPYSSHLSLLLYSYGANNNQFYYNGKFIQTIGPSKAPNPDIRWEKKVETNVGIDASMFNNRLSVALDYYQRKTKDLLWDYSVPSPPNLSSSIKANVGEIKNSGIELVVSGVPVKTADFEWNINFNYSKNKNEVVSLSNDNYELANDYLNMGYPGNPIQTYTHRIEIGKPVGNFYGWKVSGLDDNGKWIIEEVLKDGEINEDDKQIIGNGLPKFNIGFTNSFKYKNFDLSVSMRGAFGFQVLNFMRMHYQPIERLPLNLVTQSLEKPFGGDSYVWEASKYVDYYLEDGDYLKIDNIDFGYTIPIKSKYIKSARIYASAYNLFTFTKYTGVDPEVSISGLTPGYDNNFTYPNTKTYTFGLNINL